jgi:hypothetical protein
MKRTLFILAFLAAPMVGQTKPATIYIDPATRWESVHDQTGIGSKAELTMALLKACPETLQSVDSRETANFTVLVQRVGASSGQALIYSGGALVNSFKPGFGATLKKTADRVCTFVRSKQ